MGKRIVGNRGFWADAPLRVRYTVTDATCRDEACLVRRTRQRPFPRLFFETPISRPVAGANATDGNHAVQDVLNRP